MRKLMVWFVKMFVLAIITIVIHKAIFNKKQNKSAPFKKAEFTFLSIFFFVCKEAINVSSFFAIH